MAKPETSFTAGIHKHLPLPSALHREKMANPYRGGTADYWYSGRRDLWIEWKFLVVPKRDSTMIDLVTKGDIISPLQRQWLNDRYSEGRNVWVIVGCKAGGVLFQHQAWEIPLSAETFRALVEPRKSLADAIAQFTSAQK